MISDVIVPRFLIIIICYLLSQVRLYPTDNLFFAAWSLDYSYVFMLGQIFHGMGSTPLLALGLAFLDESVNKEESPLFVGELTSTNLPV